MPSDFVVATPRLLIAPGSSSREVRVLSQEALMCGTQRQVWDPASLISPASNASDVLPVGSVEFVQAVIRVLGCIEPPPLDFPAALEPFLFRKMIPSTVGEIRSLANETRPFFVKPRNAIKTFTGFVLDSGSHGASDEFELEQLEVLSRLPVETPLWISDVVTWQSEWRYYVLKGEIIGSGRYDPDGADESPEPSRSVLLEAIVAFEATGAAPSAYALDFGVLGTGETALVEINDGWALGYYTGTLTPKLYMRMLAVRWSEIAAGHEPGQSIEQTL